MESREFLALPKCIPDEGDNRLSLSLGHRFSRLAILTVSPDGPYCTKLAVDPDDGVMEFIVVAAVNQRLADHHGFSGLLRKGASLFSSVNATGRPARIADLQATKVHEPETVVGKGLPDGRPGIVANRACPFACQQLAHPTLAHVGFIPAVCLHHNSEIIKRQWILWVRGIVQELVCCISSALGVSLSIEGE